MTLSSETSHNWRDAVDHIIHDARVRRLFFLGFSSGLPILLVFGTLSFWLREAGVDRSTIGYVSWVALAYAVKWVWSPLVDRLPLVGLTTVFGRRRGWMLLAQAGVIIGLLGMAVSDPRESLEHVVLLAILVAFSSATQDIAIDAYRIESAEQRMQGLLAAAYSFGYRLAMICASAGVLWIAAAVDTNEETYEQLPWMVAYGSMAALMLVGVITTLFAPEPKSVKKDELVPSGGTRLERFALWFKGAVIEPFADFFKRYGWLALLILLLISTYRISDIVLGVISNVFYKDMGFTKDEIATVSKVFGVIMTLLGTGLGGVAIYRFGVMPILFIGALLSAATNLLFSMLAVAGHDFWMLVAVVGMDNLSAGVASAAFIAYLSSLTNVSYSATQYALFSSVMLLFPKFIGGFSGVMVDAIDYPYFFTVTALMGLPVLVLVMLAWRYTKVELKRD